MREAINNQQVIAVLNFRFPLQRGYRERTDWRGPDHPRRASLERIADRFLIPATDRWPGCCGSPSRRNCSPADFPNCRHQLVQSRADLPLVRDACIACDPGRNRHLVDHSAVRRARAGARHFRSAHGLTFEGPRNPDRQDGAASADRLFQCHALHDPYPNGLRSAAYRLRDRVLFLSVLLSGFADRRRDAGIHVVANPATSLPRHVSGDGAAHPAVWIRHSRRQHARLATGHRLRQSLSAFFSSSPRACFSRTCRRRSFSPTLGRWRLSRPSR